MSSSLKSFFVDELKEHYRGVISGAAEAEVEAGSAAAHIRSESRRREDTKDAVMQGRMEAGHRQRRQRARDELETLVAFAAKGLPKFRRVDPVAPGALVDVRVETDDGDEERTLFLLPVGAGTELHGPGGDGFVSVVTPGSPVGRSLLGARVGDSVEVVIHGRDREWSVIDVI